MLKPGNETIILSGLGGTLEEAADIIKGIGTFFATIKSMLEISIGIIGLDVLLLLIVVSLISFALSFLGIPKGKFLFFSSMFIADMFWYAWIKSFYSDNLPVKILAIIKTNAILFIPFLVIYFARTPAVSGKLIPGIIYLFKYPFIKKRRNFFSTKKLFELIDKIHESSLIFQKSIHNDILKIKGKDEIILSPESIKYKKELEEILKEFERK